MSAMKTEARALTLASVFIADITLFLVVTLCLMLY